NIEALINELYSELGEECKNKKEIEEMVKMINTSIDKFRRTINDLSVKVKFENSENDNASEVSFKEIVEDVKSNLLELIEDANPIFTEDFSKVAVVKIPVKILRSIMQNLISNAIKFRSPDRKLEINI